MSLIIKDLDNGIGSLIIGSGVITREEYVTVLKKHLSEDLEKFRKYRYNIADYTAVLKVEVLAEDIRMIAGLCREVAKKNNEIILARVAPKDITFGLSRMSEAFLDETGWEIMVFRARDEAEAWIRKRVMEKFGIENLKLV